MAAWAEPDIAGQATVPGSGRVEDAERWIDGAATRREMGLSLDLVVGPIDGDAVWGEVGLAGVRLSSGDATRDEIEIGWWVLPAHRRRGIATAAARLLARWALTDLGAPRLVARIDRGSTASETVADHIGLHRLAPLDPTRDLWTVQMVPGTKFTAGV
jgi:RimJ/RimL family protein N-acetyltransferase